MDSNPNMASEAAEDAEAFLPPVIGEYCKYPKNKHTVHRSEKKIQNFVGFIDKRI